MEKLVPGKDGGAGTSILDGPVPDYEPPTGPVPTLEELRQRKAEQDAGKPKTPPRGKQPPGDRPPQRPKPSKEQQAVATPMPVAGTIARGMNKLYARAGKICKVMDPEIGEAILSVTKKESADDVTVGEAWEELAKTNPRVRAFLLKALQGGAWGQLVMCHVPILMAIIMKDAIRKHIPFMKLITALMEEDSEGEPSEVTKATGLKKEDVDEAMKVAMSMLPQMMANMGHGSATGTERAPTVEAEAS